MRACRRRCAGSRPGSIGLNRVRRARRRAAATRSRRRWRGRRPTGCWSPRRRCARASPSTRSTRSPTTIPGSSSGSTEIVARGGDVCRERPAERCRRAAAAQGDGLFRQAPRRARACARPARRRHGRDAGARAPACSTTRARRWPARPPRTRCARCATGSACRPVFKRIDTCAAEFEAKTPYMYSTYEAPSFGEPENEASRATAARSSSSAAGPTGSGRGSSSIIAAATPASRWPRPASRRS